MVQPSTMGDDDFGDWEEGASTVSNHVTEFSHTAASLKSQLSQEQSQEELSPVSRQPDMDLTGLRSYRKGDLCWYMTRSGTWEAVEVVSVDNTVSPPSFGIQVEGIYRETEWYRLRPRTQGQPPPPLPKRTPRRAAAAATAARPARQQQQQQQNGELLNGSHAPAAPAVHAAPQSPAAHTVAAAAAAVAAVPSPVPPLSTAPPAAGSAAAADNDDAFGEFESAWPAPVAALVATPSPLVHHPAPPLQHPLVQQPTLQHPLQQQPPAPAPSLSPPATSQPAASGLWQRWHQRQQQGHHGEHAHSLPPAPLHLHQQQLAQQGHVQLRFPSHPHQPPPPPCTHPQQQQPPQQQHQPQQQHSFWPSGTHAHVTPPTSPTKSKSHSPAVDRFHSFLRMAVPEVALRRLSLDGNGSEAAGAGGEGGAAAAPAAASSVLGPSSSSPGVASPRLGHGVDRAAPLPLDIFGEEELPGEDPPVALPPALPSSPVAAGTAPTAGAQHGQQQQQQQQQHFLASPKAAVAAVGPAAPLSGGSGQEDDWGDDFGDFVEAVAEPVGLPMSPEVAVTVPTSTVPHPPASSGSQMGSVPSSPPGSHHSTPSVGDSAVEIHGSGEAGGGKGAAKLDVAAVAAGAGGVATAPAALVEPGWEQQQPASPAAAAATCATAAANVQPGSTAGPASVASAAGSSKRTSLDVSLDEHHTAASAAATAPGSMPAQQPQEQQQQVAGAPVAVEAVVPSSWRGQPSVADYGVTWVLLLEAAAPHLELGQRLWGQASTSSSCCASALLDHPGAQQYLASLGQVFLAASAVQVAARLLGLFGLVTEMQEAWARCLAAWEAPAPTQQQQPQQEQQQQCGADGESVPLLSFRQAVERASISSSSSGNAGQGELGSPTAEQQPPQRLQHDEAEEGSTQPASSSLASQLEVLHKAEGEAAGLSSDVFPRMLEWCEGLDGITLLPLCLLEGLPVSSGASWLKGRPCLAAVGNLWAGCIRKPVDLD